MGSSSPFPFLLLLYLFGAGLVASFGGFTTPLSSLQLKFPCVGHSLVVCPYPPQCQQRIGFPFLPLNGPAADVGDPYT